MAFYNEIAPLEYDYNQEVNKFLQFSYIFYNKLANHIHQTYGIPAGDFLTLETDKNENCNITERCVSLHENSAIYRIAIKLNFWNTIAFRLSKGDNNNSFDLALFFELNFAGYSTISEKDRVTLNISDPNNIDFTNVDRCIINKFKTALKNLEVRVHL